MGWFSHKDEKPEQQQSEYDKALEEEYYQKRAHQIFDASSDDEEWQKIERRLQEIEQIRKRK